MEEKVTVLRFAGEFDPEEHCAAMKAVFLHLFSSGAVTYSQFLFPYVDSLLLSEYSAPCFFGSHAIFWEISREQIENCVRKTIADNKALLPQISEIELNAPAIDNFLNETTAVQHGVGVGNFSSLISGSARPWSLREISRGLCSFAEHISRMKGYTTHGFSGGRLIISADDGVDEKEISALYNSKTGGIADIINFENKIGA